jgi:heptosyltransferase-2
MKVLIIQQKMIGDVLTSSILFEALKEKHPDWEIHYLINTHTFSVVEYNPFIDKFIFFTPQIEQSKSHFFKFLKSIQKEKYDIVIDAYSKLSSNLITLFSGAKTKISKRKWYTSLLYTKTFKYKNTAKTNAGLAIENRLQLLEPFGIENKIFKPKIHLTKKELETAKQFLLTHHINLSKPIYMISVLGSNERKTYPLPYMAKVIDQIVAQTNGQILFNYIPKQELQAKQVFDLCLKTTQKHIYFNVFGTSLTSFLAITNYCTAIIGNEGGAVNMAKALNVKTFTIFSPWIDKETWSIFENDLTNISVHLKDYKPELYTSIQEKKMKSKSLELYNAFDPELIKNKLSLFLNQFKIKR